MEETQRLHALQFRFQPQMRTSKALSSVMELMKDSLSRGKAAVVASIDVRNTFNAMPWSSIQRVLVEKGFTEWLCYFVQPYLESRTVRMRLQSAI